MSSRKNRPKPVDRAPELPEDPEPEAAILGETLRRGTLGLTAALIVARACWPAEFRQEGDSGSGLYWALLMLVAGLLAIASMWLVGGLRLRRSWADVGVVGLIALVGISATHAAERRIGINFAWDWGAIGLGYLLLRNLPRTAEEKKTLVGILICTAVALAAYGLYQVAREFPRDREFFLRNSREAMRRAGLGANADPQTIARFRDRLVGSKEPVATFALTNTLAGFLVGPAVVVLVIGLRGLAQRATRVAALLCAPLGLMLLACLLLTKSRSAYLGLMVAMGGLAWRERHRVPLKRIVAVGAALLVVAGIGAVAGVMTGQLDRQVVTESFKSLSYRWEYWRGAWAVITDGPTRWLVGIGPGNFAGPYLRHKLVQSSEEILDPHNFALEVWAIAGLPALLFLLMALGGGLWECFAKARTEDVASEANEPPPPRIATWLVLCGWAGIWLLPVLLGKLDLFEPDRSGLRMNLGISPRWLILSGAWFATALIGGMFWKRIELHADALGLGALAIAVNLLAAGGIAFAPVALMLWGLLALGQDLRIDRPSGVRVPVGGRGLAFVPAAVLACAIGAFLGTSYPHWRAEAMLASAEAAVLASPPDYEKANKLYNQAAHADPFASRGWLGWANLEFRNWQLSGRDPIPLAWHRIDAILKNAMKRPRNPDSLLIQHRRALMARAFLEGPTIIPSEQLRIRTDRLDACGNACRLYPTNPALRAELAEALADLNHFGEAIEQGEKARILDDATPHADKKMPTDVRTRLNQQMPRWREAERRTRR